MITRCRRCGREEHDHKCPYKPPHAGPAANAGIQELRMTPQKVFNPTAFVIVHVTVTADPPRLDFAGVYSSEMITQDLRNHRLWVVLKGYGADFEEGIQHLRTQFREQYNAWLYALLTPSSRELLSRSPVLPVGG